MNYLLHDERHQINLGETKIVFWADRPAPKEDECILNIFDEDTVFGEDKRAEDNNARESIQERLSRIRAGIPLKGYDTETRYFIFGTTPNTSRLIVHFFEISTFGSLLHHYEEYLQDIAMEGVKQCSICRLLLQAAPPKEKLSDRYKAIQTLIYQCMRALITGARFPRSLSLLLLSRMRADQGGKDPYDMGKRVALLKACAVRDERFMSKNHDGNDGRKNERSLKVSLDKENSNQGYVLGRLFAIMEHVQRVAIPNLNATIRDRYIGAASSTPARVFQPLLRNYHNHLGNLRKEKPKLGSFLERQFNEAMSLISGSGSDILPAVLDTNDQINFFVGYHHQQENLWKRREEKDAEVVEDDSVPECEA